MRYTLRALLIGITLVAVAIAVLRDEGEPHEYTIAPIGEQQADFVALYGEPHRREDSQGRSSWRYDFPWGELLIGFKMNGRCNYVGYRRLDDKTWRGMGIQ